MPHPPLMLVGPCMQALTTMLCAFCAADSPPEPLWSHVASWSGPLGPSQSLPHNQADCCPSSDGTAAVVPKSVPGASPAPAETTGRAPASGCQGTTAVGNEERVSAQRANITSLAFGVSARLWELLADGSIVGGAKGPALWLASSKRYLFNTGHAMSAMLNACSGAPLPVAHTQDTPTAQSALLQVEMSQAAVQRQRQLSSLTPAVPWGRMQLAAFSIAGAWGDPDVVGLLSHMASAACVCKLQASASIRPHDPPQMA
jgi:hypothetical protein